MGSAHDLLSSIWRPVARQVAGRYVAGESPEDARRTCDAYGTQHLGSTVGFWNRSGDTPELVAGRCGEALEALRGTDAYVSLKSPALGEDRALIGRLASRARELGLRLHLDSHAHDQADAAWAHLEHFAGLGLRIGSSLPARWARSREDAERAIVSRLPLRIVKGHWPDPTGHGPEARDGFLERAEQLAGRAAHVAIATHDPVLARASLSRLLAAKTPCELEVLHGWNAAPALEVARELGVRARVYVPFGNAVLPYRLSELRHEPRVVWRALSDTLRASVTG